MKALVLIPAFVACNGLMAQDSGFGAGLILGEPTGISLKGWISAERAIDGAIAWSLPHGGSAHIHADYLFHNYDAIKVNKGRLPIYYGPGVRMRIWNDNRHWHGGEWHDEEGSIDLAVRFPVGLDYQFGGAPLDLFLEIVPALGIVPATYFDVDGGLGMRFWF